MGDGGRFGSFELCPCCGVEWGYDDATADSALEYRERWIGAGAPWRSRFVESDGLSVSSRLARLKTAESISGGPDGFS